MANPSGEMKYWFNGLPAEGTDVVANDSGTMKYFFNGLPAEWVTPTEGGAPPPTATPLRMLMGMGQ